MLKTKTLGQESWTIVYDKAIRDDGSLFFPEKLSKEFLDQQRKLQGSYIFTNQYQNEIIPSDEQDFKKEWLKYYTTLPERKHTFAFIDPAISLEDESCYTALVVVDIDENAMRYLKVAKRFRITATQTVKLIFDIYDIYKPNLIGIETVAYQEALMHFIDAEMRKRNVILPVHGIKRSSDKNKEMRIRSLVPWFEWGRILIKPGLTEFEDEYAKFPRGRFVDILDALSSIDDIAYKPQPERKVVNEPHPSSREYEREFIRRLEKKGQTS